ncbi:carbon catabolite repression protein CreD [Histoplasma capsulatum var. duboisii H88]|uniref:Carbon catabolite repressor D n=1 Tax=Ajellomyces capsulatus (strain H88) TaxID=544711 RepID=A0A8A1LZU3_AJEC8|nr:carbon catabolite repression protein CreD [Histoplasma capsulatum var. duboisii H88]
MPLSFLTNGGTASQAKYFDIRLDNDYIVFRGNEHEAASTLLNGKLLLCLSEPLQIKYLRLNLTGMSKILFHGSARRRKPAREHTFFEKTWSFKDAGKNKLETLPAGNYDFPFDIILPGSLPESIEGLRDTFITYRFKAEIGRKYAKSIVVRKPLRIIRTLDPSALELSHAMSVENIWPNKIEYSISTPSKALIFGTSVQVDFHIIPLLKGLTVGTISTQLVETHDFVLNPEAAQADQLSHKWTKVILDDSCTLDQLKKSQSLDGEVEGFAFSRILNLPKSLSKCLQDADTRGIKIKHKLKFKVQLHNPDRHLSELRASLPVSIFISPHLPIGDNNDLIDQSVQSAQRAIHTMAQQAPPLYGDHRFDQLYSEIDCSGYRTPGSTSGPGTPLLSLSRSLSAENINGAVPLGYQHISPSVLHTRLSDLHLNGTALQLTPPSSESPESAESARDSTGQEPQPLDFGSGIPSINIQSPGIVTPATSRPPSEDGNIYSGQTTPNCHISEVEHLSRVPSYATAVRSHPSPHYCEGLPDYQAATAGDAAGISMTPALPPQSQQGRGRRRSHSASISTEIRRRPRLRLHGWSHSDDIQQQLRMPQVS